MALGAKGQKMPFERKWSFRDTDQPTKDSPPLRVRIRPVGHWLRRA